jgi:hypothetical protein
VPLDFRGSRRGRIASIEFPKAPVGFPSAEKQQPLSRGHVAIDCYGTLGGQFAQKANIDGDLRKGD